MTDKQLVRLLKEEPEKGLREVMRLYGAHSIPSAPIFCGEQPGRMWRKQYQILCCPWKSRDNFRETRGVSFKTYCYGIARKTALSKRRRVFLNREVLPVLEDTLAPQESVAVDFGRLLGTDEKTEWTTLIPGTWILEWNTDVKDVSKTYAVQKKFIVQQGSFTIESVKISPFSIKLTALLSSF